MTCDADITPNAPLEIVMPDFEANWKWNRRLNPHTDEITEECTRWAASFNAFSPKAQEIFERGKFGLLTGLSFPNVTKNQLRTACDLMNVFFIFDEHSDKSDGPEVWNMVHVILDAMENTDKPRPAGEWVGGEVARDFWARAKQVSTKSFQDRFLKVWKIYLEATAEQADDRDHAKIRNIDDYFEIRRRTIGARPSFAIFEMDMELPEEVLNHAVVQELTMLAIDMTIIANDVISYNKEQAAGDDEHNLVTSAMKETGKTLQEVMDWTGEIHADKVRRFNQLYLAVPRFGGRLDRDLQIYLDDMAQWVVAYVQWSFESERYFGKIGMEILRTRRMHLLPKKIDSDICPIIVDDDALAA